MQSLHNQSNYAYIVQVSGFASGKAEYYAVEQYLSKPGDRRLIDVNREQVAHRLRQVAARQQLIHQIVDEGPWSEVMARAMTSNMVLR